MKILNKIDPELNVFYEGQGIQLFEVQKIDVVEPNDYEIKNKIFKKDEKHVILF
jgi:hypothetical protein